MNDRRTMVLLFAATAVTAATVTVFLRILRSRSLQPVRQIMTVSAPRPVVDRFVSERENLLQAAGSARALEAIERFQLRDAPGGRGTEFELYMRGRGKYAVKEVLRRAKALIEAGEIPTGDRAA